MNVLAHPDPFVLEEEMVRRTRRALEADPFGRILILVPTVRLAHHVQRRLARELSACLGVDVLTHHALVRRILDERGERVRPASPRLLGALLARVLEGLGDNRWSRFVAERPAALPALLETLADLREAAIEPAAARRALADGPGAPLAAVYEAWSAALAERARAGLADRAALVRAALPGAAEHARRYGVILHHGAYELIGVHRELVRALDARGSVTFLLPAEPGAPAWAYAERFARTHLGGEIKRLPGPVVSPLGERLASLYDEESRPDPAPAGAILLRHAQGARDEVQAAVHSALDGVASSVPAAEIAIVGRTLRPYGSPLEEAFEASGAGDAIPWTTSLSAPLRRHTAARDLVLLLRVIADDFPRAATAELLRSRHLRWRTLVEGPPPPVETVEVWSRAARVVGGLEEWAEELPRWAGRPRTWSDMTDEERNAADEAARERAARAGRIVEALRALARAVGAAPRRWPDHADRVDSLIGEVLPGIAAADDPAVAALSGLVEEMRDLEALVGDRRRVPFAEMVDWLERAVDATELPVRPADGGGPRVLDAMQARGLTFDRILWIGFQTGLFPRPPREDPFLPDAARRKLREATGSPLPVKAEGEEERLLLALLLASARERVEISWQRSDEEGRPRNPSLALREVARVVLGKPDATEWAKDPAARIRSHPRDMLRGLSERFRLLSPAEELLLVALESAGDPRAEAALEARCADLGPGLEMLRAVETPAPGDLRCDGRIGRALAEAAPSLSVSAVEQLGRCPLQYFFRRRLRVQALEEETDPFELPVLDMGIRVHRILEIVYRGLRDAGLFDAGEGDALLAAARERVATVWAREMSDVASRLRRRTPVLWAVEESRWLAALEGFVSEDLSRLLASGSRPTGLEEPISRPLPLGPGLDVTLSGRFDRILDGGGGIVVGDYKTSGNVQSRGQEADMLRGQRLQVPLYRLLAGGHARVEILGVGPEFWGDGRRAGDKQRRVGFSGFRDGAPAEEGFRETLRVLLQCRQEGRFPMIIDDGHCRWCNFRRACRRNHPPSRHREQVAPDSADLRGLARKSSRGAKFLLRDVGEEAP